MPGVHTVGVGLTTPVPATPVETPEPPAPLELPEPPAPGVPGLAPDEPAPPVRGHRRLVLYSQ